MTFPNENCSDIVENDVMHFICKPYLNSQANFGGIWLFPAHYLLKCVCKVCKSESCLLLFTPTTRALGTAGFARVIKCSRLPFHNRKKTTSFLFSVTFTWIPGQPNIIAFNTIHPTANRTAQRANAKQYLNNISNYEKITPHNWEERESKEWK